VSWRLPGRGLEAACLFRTGWWLSTSTVRAALVGVQGHPSPPAPPASTCARERAAVILPRLHGHGTGDVGWERRSVYRHTWEMVADQPLELL
jgi:hypothetical protein